MTHCTQHSVNRVRERLVGFVSTQSYRALNEYVKTRARCHHQHVRADLATRFRRQRDVLKRCPSVTQVLYVNVLASHQ